MTSAAQPVPVAYGHPKGVSNAGLPRETATAPATAGNYNFQWQMLQEGVAHFGQLTVNASVGVYVNPLGNQAQWIAQTVPANMVAGEDYPVSITMLNIGSTTWEPTTLHNLGSQDPQDNEIWGMGRVVMPIASAPPGTAVDFVFTVTAPSTPGTYAFQWEMVQDGVEHFGDFTPLVSVQVGASEVGTPDGLLTALWDNDNLLLELDAALTVTGRYTGTPEGWGGLVSQWQQAQLVDRVNSPSSSFYGFDTQGSTRMLTNPAGVVTDTYAYRAFGAAWQGGNGSTNAYRYASEYGYTRDSEAVEYVRARYLNVLQGRWMSADPLRFEAGDYNLYRYVGNEPVGRMDPSGLMSCNMCPWDCDHLGRPLNHHGRKIAHAGRCLVEVCKITVLLRHIISDLASALCGGNGQGPGAISICGHTQICMGEHGYSCDIDPPRTSDCYRDDTGGPLPHFCCVRCNQCVCWFFTRLQNERVDIWMRKAFRDCERHQKIPPFPVITTPCI